MQKILRSAQAQSDIIKNIYIMKKNFIPVLICMILSTISCAEKSDKKNTNGPETSTKPEVTTASENEKPTVKITQDTTAVCIDTLSYITGMEVANSIEKNILPLFKVEYDVMINALQQALDPKATIAIEGVSFNKDNFRQVGDRYLTDEFRNRIMATMNDSTGSVQLYKNEKEKNIISAIIGADVAYSTMNSRFATDKTSILEAINDIHNGKSKISDKAATEYTRNYFTVVVPQQNKKESDLWLASIEKEEGVKKTASGILYKIEKAGDSNAMATKDEDVVKVLYTGRTPDGKVFDSNRWDDMNTERKEMIKTYQPDQVNKDNPIEFPLNRVIKGWTEGMKLVGKGGRITLWIPSELAYGEYGSGQNIGPNQALRFDVELLEVIKQ